MRFPGISGNINPFLDTFPGIPGRGKFSQILAKYRLPRIQKDKFPRQTVWAGGLLEWGWVDPILGTFFPSYRIWPIYIYVTVRKIWGWLSVLNCFYPWQYRKAVYWYRSTTKFYSIGVNNTDKKYCETTDLNNNITIKNPYSMNASSAPQFNFN